MPPSKWRPQKYNSHRPVDDPPREAALLARAAKVAVSLHVSPDQTTRLFQAQIEASKIVQRGLLRQWAGRLKFAHPSDLKDIRDHLDRLTVEILRAYRDAESEIRGPDGLRQIGEAVRRFSLGDRPPMRAAWEVAVAPLRQLARHQSTQRTREHARS